MQYEGNQIKKNKMGAAYNMHEGNQKGTYNFAWKTSCKITWIEFIGKLL
jgi:hypothetical protein